MVYWCVCANAAPYAIWVEGISVLGAEEQSVDATDFLLDRFHESYNDMQTIIVRPGNLYGPNDKFDPEKSKVIPSLIRKVVERQNPIHVWGDGKDLKDFLYIDDFTNALIRIINNVNNYEVLNIASGKGVTIREILSMILKIEKAENLEINYDLSMPTMIPKRLINIEKAKKLINFNPETSLEEGLKKTINWYKSNDYN